MSMLAVLLLASSAPTTAQPAPQTLSGPVKMTSSQIKAYNTGLPKDHPNYIRCESRSVTGSLAMRTKECRTNDDWKRVETEGNDDARRMLDRMNQGHTNGALSTGG